MEKYLKDILLVTTPAYLSIKSKCKNIMRSNHKESKDWVSNQP